MKHPPMLWAMWRPEIILPVFFLSLFSAISCQEVNSDPRSIALGNIFSVSGITSEFTYNPATLGNLSYRVFTISHASPFLISEIGISALEAFLPANKGAFRFSSSNYGIKNFRSFSWKTDYGMRLSDKLSAGIGFRYYNTASIGQWNYLWTIGTGAGIIYHFSDKTTAGLQLNNPVTIGNQPEYASLFPGEISLGVSSNIYSNTFLLMELSQYTSGILQYKIGIENQFIHSFIIRAGFHSAPHSFSFGSGYTFGKFSVQTSFSWSGLLGFTPAVLLEFKPEK